MKLKRFVENDITSETINIEFSRLWKNGLETEKSGMECQRPIHKTRWLSNLHILDSCSLYLLVLAAHLYSVSQLVNIITIKQFEIHNGEFT